MKPRSIIAIGIPGSGKSTYAMELSKQDPGLCIVNPDSIRGSLYGYGKPGVKFDPSMEPVTWEKAEATVRSCMESGRNIYIDATNPDRFGRSNILEWFDGSGYTIEAVRFVMEPGLAILRNEKRGKQDVPEKVICEKHLSIREPAPAEGFKNVTYIGMPPTAGEIAALTAGRQRYDCITILGCRSRGST